MNGLLTVLTVAYAFGVLAMSIFGLLDWGVARSLQRDNARHHWTDGAQWQREHKQRQHEEHEREARAGARRFVQSPLWPLLAIGALVRIINDSKEDA